MVYCTACKADVEPEAEDVNGFSCCPLCGRVLEDTTFSTDVTFQKDAGGESTVLGQFVSENGQARGLGRVHGGRVYSSQTDSHERAQHKGRAEIVKIVGQLRIEPREETIESAHRLYRLALQRGFTRGRRVNQVAATCVYLLCRQDNKPFLLIDFSDQLQVNVFTLGAVFLQLARLLRMDEHPMLSRPVDPSLYIHRFASKLGLEEDREGGGAPSREQRRREGFTMRVAQTAMRLVSSMKRDWIQTGRRPSGICGAALYVATHIHGRGRPKSEVIRVVHVGEATLARRLQEFSATEAGALTPADFDAQHRHLESLRREAVDLLPPARGAAVGDGGGCEHVRAGTAAFAHGLCHACYVDFLERSGGLDAGANPPAFTRARERERRAAAAEETLLLERGAGGDEDVEGEMTWALQTAELRPFQKLLGDGGDRVQGGVREQEEERVEAAGGGPLQAPAASQGEDGTPGAGRRVLSEREASPPAPTSGTLAASSAGGPAASDPKRTRAVFQRWKPRKKKSLEAPLTFDDAANLLAPSVRRGAAPGSETSGAAADEPKSPAAQGARDSHPQELHVREDPAADEPPSAGGGDGDKLSDIEDDDIAMYLADDAEVAYKEEIWNMMNRDWLERQAAKAAVVAATEKAAAEQRAAQEAAEAAGIAFKRSRGRPLGSKSKPRHDSGLPPPETPQEAAMRMLDTKKLSSKINYNVLADLFDDPVPDPGISGGTPTTQASQEPEQSVLSAELAASQMRGGPAASIGGLATLSTLRPSGLTASHSRLGSLRSAGAPGANGTGRHVRFAK